MIPVLLFYGDDLETKLSAWKDWENSVVDYPHFKVDACDLYTDSYKDFLNRIDEYELVVFLHMIMPNRRPIPTELKYRLMDRKRAQILYFIGNEYKLFPQIVAMMNELRTEYIGTQIPLESAKWAYEHAIHTKEIIPLPQALNPMRFKPTKSLRERPLDIGVRAYRYTRDVFDEDRVSFIELFQNRFPDLRKDISFDPDKRFDPQGWAAFLSSCRGTISTEAGAPFIDRDGTLFDNMRYECRKKPDASHQFLFDKLYQHERSPSGKALTARHFDAIGTKTVNIMLEGKYNGVLLPDKHFIAVKRDLSNLEEAMEKFRDDDYCQKLVDGALEDSLANHTFRHRIDVVYNTIFG
jgi:hypothetical protein